MNPHRPLSSKNGSARLSQQKQLKKMATIGKEFPFKHEKPMERLKQPKQKGTKRPKQKAKQRVAWATRTTANPRNRATSDVTPRASEVSRPSTPPDAAPAAYGTEAWREVHEFWSTAPGGSQLGGAASSAHPSCTSRFSFWPFGLKEPY